MAQVADETWICKWQLFIGCGRNDSSIST